MVGLVAFILCLIAVIYVPPGPSLLHSVRISALLDGGTWHVFNGLITRLKNAKIARIAI
jgi:hypothetical protein